MNTMPSLPTQLKSCEQIGVYRFNSIHTLQPASYRYCFSKGCTKKSKRAKNITLKNVLYIHHTSTIWSFNNTSTTALLDIDTNHCETLREIYALKTIRSTNIYWFEQCALQINVGAGSAISQQSFKAPVSNN